MPAITSCSTQAASSDRTKEVKTPRIVSKKPGLSIDLSRDGLSESHQCVVVRGRSSPSSRPFFDPLVSDSDSDANSRDDDAQYVIIPANSPFYGRPSAYSCSAGFSFACGALAREDAILTPAGELFFYPSQEVPAENCRDTVIVVDATSMLHVNPQLILRADWDSVKSEGSPFAFYDVESSKFTGTEDPTRNFYRQYATT